MQQIRIGEGILVRSEKNFCTIPQRLCFHLSSQTARSWYDQKNVSINQCYWRSYLLYDKTAVPSTFFRGVISSSTSTTVERWIKWIIIAFEYSMSRGSQKAV